MSSAEEFVNVFLEAYLLGENNHWVAEKLGLSRQAVGQKATSYRRRGIKLPVLKRQFHTGSKIDVASLNKLIDLQLDKPSNLTEGANAQDDDRLAELREME